MSKRSIFFLTFHKAASSFFSHYVLKHIKSYKHVDYAAEMFETGAKSEVQFKSHGYVYGPIRMSINAEPMKSHLLLPIISNDMINKYRLICFVRDPRAILVSYFYSEAFSHVISQVEEIRQVQLENRRIALSLGIDKYVLEKANFVSRRFELLKNIISKNNDCILLRYEDMIANFDGFYEKLVSFVPLEKGTHELMYAATRPVNGRQGQLPKHRRDGSIENYRQEIRPETLRLITANMSETLEGFGYES